MNLGHPGRKDLERFSRGETAAAEERWIEDHLRSGCALCQREVDDLLRRLLQVGPGVPAAVSPLAPIAPIASIASGDGSGEDAGNAADHDDAWDRLFSSLEQRLSLATAERYWTYSRTWLYAELSEPEDSPPSPSSLPGKDPPQKKNRGR